VDEPDIIREFLIESSENLAQLEQEIVQLEKDPKNPDLLGSIFRTIHTVKGTGGMLAFSGIERVAHLCENLLSQLRNGLIELTPALVSIVLESVDAIKAELSAIEATGAERGTSPDDLLARLKAVNEAKGKAPFASAPPPATKSGPTAKDPDTSGSTARTVSDSSIRVDVSLLDRLMNLVGELVLARNQIIQFGALREDSALHASAQRLDLITTELQGGVTKTRMQPIGVVWDKFPRLVRDLAAASGKSIQIEMDGADTELDKTIIESIKDPLTHLIRNSCDHGIEMPADRTKAGKRAQGTISLRGYHEGGQVNIEIHDDGAGISPQRLKEKALQKGLLRSEQAERMSERELLDLIFLPGFSTADKVTNISGRGVGMDVVKTNIERIGGTVDLLSQTGQGTTFKLKIPLTLAIIPGLVVTSGIERFVIPQVSLVELIALQGETGRSLIESVHGTPMYRRRGKLLPLVYLNHVLGTGECDTPAESISIVVLQAEDRQFGLVVDRINDTQEIVVKPLGKHLKGLNCYAGACIMGDGSVALILDVTGVAQRASVISEDRTRGREKIAEAVAGPREEKHSFLLFAGPDGSRMAVPLDLVARLEELPSAQMEKSGTQWVAQYRGGILPVVHLRQALQERRVKKRSEAMPPDHAAGTTLQVVVCTHEGRQVGLLVEQILDIVEESAELRYPASREGILYSAVINGKVTELVDVAAVLRMGKVKFSHQIQPAEDRAQVAH